MTKEEAIKTLRELWRETNDSWYEEVFRMAIEALSAANLKEEFESAEYEDYEHATLVDIKEPLKVSVVRCKDCKNWRESHSEDEESYCYIDGRTTDSTDFCSHGERQCNYFGERREK